MHITMWTPEPDMVDHTGKSVAVDDDSFVAPPPEIGNVISASTTLKQFAEPVAAAPRRIRVTLITGVVIFALIWLLSLADWKPEQIRPFWEVSMFVLCAAMLIAWLNNKPNYTCSYVGTRGVARFACYGSRSRITLNEIFRFETATSLKTSMRNIYVNGNYLNTEYNFRWFDSMHNQRYKLAGVCRRRKSNASPDDALLVGQAAEESWTDYLLPDALASVERGGTWRFDASRGRCVEVGCQYVEFRGERVGYEDLNLRVERGFIVFRRAGDKRAWYKFDRAPRVRYAELENAMLMIRLVDEITGLSISDVNTASDARYHLWHM